MIINITKYKMAELVTINNIEFTWLYKYNSYLINVKLFWIITKLLSGHSILSSHVVYKMILHKEKYSNTEKLSKNMKFFQSDFKIVEKQFCEERNHLKVTF